MAAALVAAILVCCGAAGLASAPAPAKKPAPKAPPALEHVESREEEEEEEEREGWEEHYAVLADFPAGPSIPAHFRNPPQAPVVIVEARVPMPNASEHERSSTESTLEPAVKLENRSTRTVVAVRLRYKAEAGSQKIGKYKLRLRPRRTAVVVRPQYEIWGAANEAKVQLLGVKFADGREWGDMDETPHPRDVWVYPLKPEKETR